VDARRLNDAGPQIGVWLLEIPTDFNQMLHLLRTCELQATEPVNGTMVSVGCNGAEYFDCIDSNLGRPEIHIGLEYYLSEPPVLPDNVRWIANTAGDMRDVRTNSADVVFAGQTVEHLWFEELAGFFLESARVLAAGGRLLFDSPNREISNALKWNHPEHTIELMPQEGMEIAELAGFDVSGCVGHWLCRDRFTGNVLPLTEIVSDGLWAAERRIEAGRQAPEDSFSWWIEAKRSTREPDVVGVYNFARALSQRHFADRVGKTMQSQIPERISRNGGEWVNASKGWSGALVFGPYAPLAAGEWLVRFQVGAYSNSVSPGKAEVFQNTTNTVLSEVVLPPSFEGGWVDVPVRLTGTMFGLEYRLWSNGRTAMSALVGVEIFRQGIA